MTTRMMMMIAADEMLICDDGERSSANCTCTHNGLELNSVFNVTKAVHVHPVDDGNRKTCDECWWPQVDVVRTNNRCRTRTTCYELCTASNWICRWRIVVFIVTFIAMCSFLGVQAEGEFQNASAVVGGTAELPCDITEPDNDDKTHLVLWYKEGSGNPIYSLDLREKKMDAVSKYDPNDIRSRVTFFPDASNPYLLVRDVRAEDESIYRCRVDFKKSRTRNSLVSLSVVVPPKTPSILGEKGLELGSVIGPYNEGSNLFLACEVVGGRPPPRVTWWRESSMIDDSYEVTSLSIVRNDVLVQSLSRSDFNAVYTCQATNNNMTQPVTNSVTVDMNLKPLDIRIAEEPKPLSANKKYELVCRSSGSRPPPILAWWKGDRRMKRTEEAISTDGNVTSSVLQFTPLSDDNGRHLTCRAENPAIPSSSIHTTWILDIHYSPALTLSAGDGTRLDNVREGDRISLECSVRSNPTVQNVQWRYQGKLLEHNVSGGIIAANKTLVLQRIRRVHSGSYSCSAVNSEGDSESNRITLQVKHPPVCKGDLQTVFRAARNETVRIVCDVIAYPSDVKFKWTSNTSNESEKLHYNFERTRSVLSYTPRNERDFGSFYCWAGNDVGYQKSPCIFTIEPAGPPDSLFNCSLSNQTENSFLVECKAGYDGGLSPSFICEVWESLHKQLRRKVMNTYPSFYVTDLESGTNYIVNLYVVNDKGHSDYVRLSITTKSLNAQGLESERMTTTILGVVIGIVVALVLVGVTILIVMRVKNGNNLKRRNYQPEQADSHLAFGSSFMPERSHIPLRKDMDSCADGEEKSPDIIASTNDQDFPSVQVKCLQKLAFSHDGTYENCRHPGVLTTFGGCNSQENACNYC